MTTFDWSDLPSSIYEKYSSFAESGDPLMDYLTLNKAGTVPMNTDLELSVSFETFSKEYNSVLLTAHLFENLLLFEDIRHEQNGHNDFQINIPVHYFRYPAFNNLRDEWAFTEINQCESELLKKVISSTKREMNYTNDENIAKENLHKLEFISYFSYFEAYLENILIEHLGYNKQKALYETKHNSIGNLLKIVIIKVNPKIENLLNFIKRDFFEFLTFCYLVRNAHTHNFGKASPFFIKKCIQANIITEEYRTTDSGEKVSSGYFRTAFSQPEIIIEEDKYLRLSHLSHYFRNYIRECVFIIELCILEKT